MKIWDTAGQERFMTLTKSFYRTAHALIIAYDCTDRKTFGNVKMWLESISDVVSNIPRILACTKTDLNSERVITNEEGIEYA